MLRLFYRNFLEVILICHNTVYPGLQEEDAAQDREEDVEECVKAAEKIDSD